MPSAAWSANRTRQSWRLRNSWRSQPPVGLTVGIDAFERVPKHLAHGGGIGPERGLNPLRKHARREAVEFLEDPRPRPIEVDPIVENDVDRGESEHRRAADGSHSGNPEERNGERVSDLVLHVLG